MVVAISAIVLSIPPAQAAFSITGHYYISDGLSYAVTDACELGPLDGVDSDCKALPTYFQQAAYTLTATGSTLVVGLQACFYSAVAHINCQTSTGTVPPTATRVAISSATGFNVHWTMTI